MVRQAGALFLVISTSPGTAGAATITPTVFTDDDVANGNCTLREAIEASQDNVAVDLCTAGDPAPTVDTIVLGTGVYALGGTSPPFLEESVSIEGAGQAQTEILADVPDRLLHVFPGAELTIEGITLGNVAVGTSADPAGCLENRGTLTMTDSTVRGCRPFQHGGALSAVDGSTTTLTRVTLSDNEATSGGAIVGALATLHLIECTVEDNVTTNGVGGAINASGHLILERTLVRRNHAATLGGGIRANSAGTTVELIDSTVDRNTAGAGGGGLSINGGATATLVNTTVSHNRAATLGGGMQASSGGTILAENSTISGNRAGIEGGAVYGVDGAVTLTHVTIAANQAPANSVVGVDENGSVTFINTLLADGGCTTAGGTFTSGGGNLESPGDTCGLGDPSDQTGIADPALSGLVDLGGATLAQLPLPGSPARDAALAGDCPADDQRGQARPVDGGGGAECDVGSVEALLAETAPLFTDGFEVGDTLAWSATVP